MRKIISILLVVVMLSTLLVGCNKDNDIEITPNNTSKPTDSVVEESKPDDTKQDTTPDESQPNDDNNENNKYSVDIVEFDEKYLLLEKTMGFDFDAGIIDIPTKTVPSEGVVQQFTTAEEFKQYLDLYGNVEDHSQDSVSIEYGENGTEFNYSHGWTGATSLGFDLDFFFIMHPNMPVGYEIDFENSYYDKNTGDIYAFLVKDDIIDIGEAQSTFGFVYMSIDDDFVKENNISRVHIVLPRETDKIILDGSEGNKHGLYEFVQFDRDFMKFEELGLFDVDASIIDIPTSQKPTASVFEKFETEEQFKNYLSQYGDVIDHSKDTIKIEYTEDGVVYQYSGSTTFSSSSGFDLMFYFMMHPDMPVGYELVIGDAYYDEATGTVYIFIERDDYVGYEGANSTFAFIDISIDEDFTKDHTINKICFVMPE